MIRQPIIAVLGHVDSGKTSLLDFLRGTLVAENEAGQITQHIGATEIPIGTVKEICGALWGNIKGNVTVPGLLFIDTPGHEAFTSLRERGGSIADIAILVVDQKVGVMPQTIEAINILKHFKVPFVIALNKIDFFRGWSSNKGSFLMNLKNQNEESLTFLEEKIYEVLSKLSEFGFNAQRFDHVSDFTQEIAIVPVSARTGEGIPELLMVLAGLAQKYLEDKLRTEVSGKGKATVLEVRAEKGLGMTVDAILYDGMIKRGDTIVLGGKEKPITTKVRSLLKPKPLSEIRVGHNFDYIDMVVAASGVKIAAPGLEEALPGSPLLVCSEEEVPGVVNKLEQELSKSNISEEIDGVTIRTDTLGALEALEKLLKNAAIPIRSAKIGNVSKTDVKEAVSVAARDEFLGVVFAFNANVPEDAQIEAKKNNVKIFEERVIYRLIENYKIWVEEAKQRRKDKDFKNIPYPCEFKVLPDCVFRASKPAIIGVEILCGKLKPGCRLADEDYEVIGELKGIQDKGESLAEATSGMQVAISVDGGVVGRNIDVSKHMYAHLTMGQIDFLKSRYMDEFTDDEKELVSNLEKKIRLLLMEANE